MAKVLAIKNIEPRRIHPDVKIRCSFCNEYAKYYVGEFDYEKGYCPVSYNLCEDHHKWYEEMRADREKLLEEKRIEELYFRVVKKRR